MPGPYDDVCLHWYCYQFTDGLNGVDCTEGQGFPPWPGDSTIAFQMAKGALYIPGTPKGGNCYVESTRRPLVLISSADNSLAFDQAPGNPKGYRDLAVHLASHGFVVAICARNPDWNLHESLGWNHAYLTKLSPIGPYLSGDVAIFAHSVSGGQVLENWEKLSFNVDTLIILANSGSPEIHLWENPPDALLTFFDVSDDNGELMRPVPMAAGHGYAVCMYERAGLTSKSMPKYKDCVVSTLPIVGMGAHFIANMPHVRALTTCFLFAHAFPNPWRAHFRRVFRTKSIPTSDPDVASMWPAALEMQHSERERVRLVHFHDFDASHLQSYNSSGAVLGVDSPEYPHCTPALTGTMGNAGSVTFNLTKLVPLSGWSHLSLRIARSGQATEEYWPQLMGGDGLWYDPDENLELLPSASPSKAPTEHGARTYLIPLTSFTNSDEATLVSGTDSIQGIRIWFWFSSEIRILDIELLGPADIVHPPDLPKQGVPP